jgi:hypothetical protein
MKTNFFHSSLLLLFLDPGSEIRDPVFVKIRIRDKHPGSATLVYVQGFPASSSSPAINQLSNGGSSSSPYGMETSMLFPGQPFTSSSFIGSPAAQFTPVLSPGGGGGMSSSYSFPSSGSMLQPSAAGGGARPASFLRHADAKKHVGICCSWVCALIKEANKIFLIFISNFRYFVFVVDI